MLLRISRIAAILVGALLGIAVTGAQAAQNGQAGVQGEQQNGQTGAQGEQQNGQSGEQGEQQNGQIGEQGNPQNGQAALPRLAKNVIAVHQRQQPKRLAVRKALR